MVSADNLNLDVLELIFGHVDSADITAVALVSKSFLAAAIPRLYRRLFYGLHQSKRVSLLSPFSTVKKYPHLAVHVQRIDITVLSSYKWPPQLLIDCASALSHCTNLKLFHCSPSPMQAFLQPLSDLKRLETIRINAQLSSEQTAILVQLKGLKNLTLDSPSWNVVVALPDWASQNLAPNLTSLAIYTSHDLNSYILDATLDKLPQLRGLHIISCSKIDHVSILSSLKHTPMLKALSFSTWDTNRTLDDLPLIDLTGLTHITIDIHNNASPDTIPNLWISLFGAIKNWMANVTSLTLKMNESLILGDTFFEDVLSTHGSTLQVLKMINCSISPTCLVSLCNKCPNLHTLGIMVPPRSELLRFTMTLSKSSSLQTLIDTSSGHQHSGSHSGPPHILAKSNIETLMQAVSNLRTIKSHSRVWTGTETKEGLKIRLQRQIIDNRVHWFMPPSSVTSW